MKKRLIIISLIILVVFLTWWSWPRANPSSGSPPITTPATKPEDTSDQSTIAPAATTPMTPAPAAAVKPGMREQLGEIMNNANRPISFFGKIIDQGGNPIPDVKVTFEIRYMKTMGPVGIADTFDYPFVTTGIDGLFSLTGAKGSLLGIKSIEKTGYEPSPKAFEGTYWYWRDKDPYQPDADHPEIFHMWKKAWAERLVKQEKMTRIPYNGTPVTFDLLTGNKGGSGDLRVTLVRNPNQITYGQKNYEWTLTVEGVEGGVIESSDEQMFLAPAEGYQPKIVIKMPADAPEWSDRKTVTLYFKSRGGKHYGSVVLDVTVGSDKPTTGLMFRSFINPSGSRNLEYDPAQNLKAMPPTP